MPTNTLSVLRRADVPDTARVLGAAFLDNPLYGYLCPDAATRRRDLEAFFRRNLAWREPLELTWVARDASGAIVGTATLEPPGGIEAPLGRMLAHWVVPTLLERGVSGVARLAWVDTAFRTHNQEAAGGARYWHVHAVAVDPGAQGRGAGLAMMRGVLEELDRLLPARPAPVVLSTQREVNLGFYAKLGFETMKRVRMEPLLTRRRFESWFLRRRLTRGEA